jgi:hypothetical protein
MGGPSFPFSLPPQSLEIGNGKEPTLDWCFISSACTLGPIVPCVCIDVIVNECKPVCSFPLLSLSPPGIWGTDYISFFLHLFKIVVLMHPVETASLVSVDVDPPLFQFGQPFKF